MDATGALFTLLTPDAWAVFGGLIAFMIGYAGIVAISSKRNLGDENDIYKRGQCIRAHLHMAKDLSTKSRRIVDEVSAKDISLPTKFFLPANFAETSLTKNF